MPPLYLTLRTVHQRPGYSEASRAGDTLYICGQVALDARGRLVGEGDIEAQARQVYANLTAILAEAGGTLRHLAKTTTLITDPAFLAPYRAVRDAVLPDPRPPNTLAVVSALADPRYLIEVEAIAVLDQPPSAG